MNQQTLEYIYRNYQPQQYYKNFYSHSIREDGRKFHQFRTMKFNVEKNKVTFSQGQNIILAQLNSYHEPVPYIGYSQSVEIIKIDVKLPNNAIRREKQIGQYVKQKINGFSNNLTQKVYFYDKKSNLNYIQVYNIKIRVVNEDGAILQSILLVLSMLLWITQITTYPSQSYDQVKYSFLELNAFYIPFKYVDTMKSILMDPTADQQQKSTLQVSFLYNILQNTDPQIVLKYCENYNKQIINGLKKASIQAAKKIPIDLKLIRSKCNQNTSFDFIISDN